MRKCHCRYILGLDMPRLIPFNLNETQRKYFEQRRPLIIHLMGCPEDSWSKEYEALPWWKKMFSVNPARLYNMHLRP